MNVTRQLLLGALSFWGPELFLYALKRKAVNGGVITLILPGVLLLAYFLAKRFRKRNQEGVPSQAAFMLLGIWILGPTAMLIAATLQGAGFVTLGASSAMITAMLGLFPPYTFIMATYDGSLYALIIVSILLPAFHFAFEQKNWIIPPSWFAHLKSQRKLD